MLRKLVSYSLLALLVWGWAATLRPAALGGPATYVLVSGDSMEPHLSEGDLVVLRAQDSYEVGDVVTFPVPEGEPGAGALIIHRIVGGGPDGFTIQGDNKPAPDEWVPAAGQVLGSSWLHIPHGGTVLRHVMEPALLAALVGGVVTIHLLTRSPKERRDDDAASFAQAPQEVPGV